MGGTHRFCLCFKKRQWIAFQMDMSACLRALLLFTHYNSSLKWEYALQSIPLVSKILSNNNVNLSFYKINLPTINVIKSLRLFAALTRENNQQQQQQQLKNQKGAHTQSKSRLTDALNTHKHRTRQIFIALINFNCKWMSQAIYLIWFLICFSLTVCIYFFIHVW